GALRPARRACADGGGRADRAGGDCHRAGGSGAAVGGGGGVAQPGAGAQSPRRALPGGELAAVRRTLLGVVPSAAHRVASTVGRVQPAGRILLRLRAWRVSPALRLRSTHGPFNTSATVPRPAPSTARVTGRSAAANSAPW